MSTPYYLSLSERDWRWLCEATQDDPADSPILRDIQVARPASYPEGNRNLVLTTDQALARFTELWREHVS